jgi:hypothetical protein
MSAEHEAGIIAGIDAFHDGKPRAPRLDDKVMAKILDRDQPMYRAERHAYLFGWLRGWDIAKMAGER